MKTRTEHAMAESDATKAPAGEGKPTEASADKESKKMSFESKMMQITKAVPLAAASEKSEDVGKKPPQVQPQVYPDDKKLSVLLKSKTQTLESTHAKGQALVHVESKVEVQTKADALVEVSNESQKLPQINSDKQLNFEAKLRDLQKSQPIHSSQVQSGPTPATLNRPAEQVNKQRSFEEKMRQMKGILKLPPLPTSLPTSLPIKIPDLTRASVPKPQAKVTVVPSPPAHEEQVKEVGQQPPEKVSQQDQSRCPVEPSKKAFEDKMRTMQKTSLEVILALCDLTAAVSFKFLLPITRGM
nr:titin-like [Cherax quadricarinatus]